MIGDLWYRYEDSMRGHGGIDMWGEWVYSHSTVEVNLHRFQVTRMTPKGVWIAPLWGEPKSAEYLEYLSQHRGEITLGEKFVAHSWRKKHAHPSLEEAKKSFIARKKRQLGILNGQVDRVETALRIIENLSKPEEAIL